MYFDTLPSEIIPIIIKHVFVEIEKADTPVIELDTLSKRRLRIHTLSMLVSENSPFRQVLSQLPLTELQLGQISYASSLWNDDGLFVIGPELFESESLELGLANRIFQQYGESVKAVSFFVDWNDLPPRKTDNSMVFQMFVALVEMYCPNVEGLELVPLFFDEPPLQIEAATHALLEQFSSQLRSIDWGTNYGHVSVPDISVCTNVRELNFPASPQLISFLRTCGSSLESLIVSFGDTNGYAEMLDLIERNCSKLSTVLLLDCSTIIEVFGEERYVSLLCSIGSQLIRAEVEELSVEKLTQVLKACPNLSIRTEYAKTDGVNGWERVGMLGSKIKYLAIAADSCRA